MFTVVETPTFLRRAEKLLSEAERAELVAYLAEHPEEGDLIRGGAGIRKMRFAAKGEGKSGGVRVIYYVYDETLPLFALMIYAKNEKDDLSADELKAVAAFAEAIRATRRE